MLTLYKIVAKLVAVRRLFRQMLTVKVYGARTVTVLASFVAIDRNFTTYNVRVQWCMLLNLLLVQSESWFLHQVSMIHEMTILPNGNGIGTTM